MTQEQIRAALDWLEKNYSEAMDAGVHGLADALYDRIQYLRGELVRTICAQDPHTTEADVRCFEGF